VRPLGKKKTQDSEDLQVHIRGENGEIIYKIIVIGDPAIGKTSLIRKFVKDQFEIDYIPTVGVNISKQPVELTINGRDLHINLMIWDLAGQPQFHLLHKVYYNGANGIILAFDLTRSYTFMNVKNWFGEIVKYGLSDKPIVLVGNKADLPEKRVVSEAHIEHMKEQLGIQAYLETSAKEGENVDQLFNDIAQMIYEHHV
jgi:small GTP-binding protein